MQKEGQWVESTFFINVGPGGTPPKQPSQVLSFTLGDSLCTTLSEALVLITPPQMCDYTIDFFCDDCKVMIKQVMFSSSAFVIMTIISPTGAARQEVWNYAVDVETIALSVHLAYNDISIELGSISEQ